MPPVPPPRRTRAVGRRRRAVWRRRRALEISQGGGEGCSWGPHSKPSSAGGEEGEEEVRLGPAGVGDVREEEREERGGRRKERRCEGRRKERREDRAVAGSPFLPRGAPPFPAV